MRFSLSLSALLLLAGCAVGPSTKFERPAPRQLSVTDTLTSRSSRSFFDSLSAARDSTRPDSMGGALYQPRALSLTGNDKPWLEILKDTTLVGLVETALANNRDLRTAVARVREYRANLGAARGEFFPQIGANGSYSTNKVVFGSLGSQKYDAVQITADLQWELDFWGKIRRSSEAAKFDYQGRDEDRRAAVVSLVSDVVTAYLELRELDQNLAVAEQTLESRKATLKLARQRFDQGVISELDVRQFEAEVAAPAASLADFARQRSQKESQLRQLLGQEPGPIARGNALAATVQSVNVPDSLPSDLIERRPDVLAAQHAWQAATARIGVAQGNRLPRFMITGQYGTQRPDFDHLFSKDAEIYTLQGGISIPLFTGGRLINEERAAKARAEQAKNQYEQSVLGALREANDALVGLRLSRDQLAAQETQTQALRRAYALAEKRYESGVSSYLEVLDAQRGLFSAEIGLAQVQRQYLGATVQLYKALGGGWGDEK
jgi:multidrug efflux system outer membrane protein